MKTNGLHKILGACFLLAAWILPFVVQSGHIITHEPPLCSQHECPASDGDRHSSDERHDSGNCSLCQFTFLPFTPQAPPLEFAFVSRSAETGTAVYPHKGYTAFRLAENRRGPPAFRL